MSFDSLPQWLDQNVKRFARQQRISHDEAVLKLIETGLTVEWAKTGGAAPRGKSPLIPGLSGKPMSDEDAAVMDEILAKAMEARRQRWERYLGA